MAGKWDLAAFKNQASALGRGGIWFIAGVVVGRGWLDGDNAIMIAGGVLTVIGGGLSGLANTNSSIVQSASQVPEVKRMDISDLKLAQAAQSADPETIVKVSPPPKEG